MNVEKRPTWGSVRNKNLKSLLICEYILELQKNLNLSIQDTKDLKDFINLGILLNYINSKDIILNWEGNKINKIQGINVEEKIYENRSFCSCQLVDVVSNVSYQYFYNYWYQFLTNWNRTFKNN